MAEPKKKGAAAPRKKSSATAKKTSPAPRRRTAAAPARKSASGVTLLSGGNPQIPKGEGDGPVQDYIAAMPEWKSDLGRRIDELVVAAAPGVRKAVKWNQPFYGSRNDDGWFMSFRCFTNYVQLAFFRGTSLDPEPPKASKHPEVRYLDVREDDELDEKLLKKWIKQANKLPGEKV